jgi:predicted AAA+ superfamily ATPase
MQRAYQPRIVDAELAARLTSTGAVASAAQPACLKPPPAWKRPPRPPLLDTDVNVRQVAAIDPALVLDGPTPRLLDEWQLEPAIWNHVRRAIDDRRQPGQFILAGSAVPPDDITRHTGAGRITRLRMRPMTSFETGASTGEISLAHLLTGEAAPSAYPGLTVSEIAREIAIGGWPGFRDLNVDQSLQAVRDYLEEIRRVDVSRVENTRRDPAKVGQLLRSLARNVGTYVAATTLARDTAGADGPLKDDTIRLYLDALQRLMIVEDQPAWAPHLRSRYTLRNSAKRHFVDPSLAVAALRATPERLLGDAKLLGFLFESLVVRDLRVYAQAADAHVLQYRDSHGLEIDAIVEVADGRWAAFEIKLGSGQVDHAAANLQKFARQIDTDRCGSAAALGVIVGTGYGYRRDDGIAVIPIGALGP